MKLRQALVLTLALTPVAGLAGCGVSTDSVRLDTSPSLFTETRSFPEQKNEEWRQVDRLERGFWTDVARIFWVDENNLRLSPTPSY
ncbi:MAG: hypothetical protein AAF288_00795 [Planctomycetota bacterium]